MTRWLLIFGLLSGCAFQSPQNTAQSEAYQRVDERRLIGTEQWLFQSSLNGLSSSHHFLLDFILSDVSSSLTFHSHFNGYFWRDGVQVRFSRADNNGLRLEVIAPGFSAQLVELSAGWIGSDGRVKLRLEIHNATSSGIRILLWRSNLSPQGEFQVERSLITAANADFDSQREGWVFNSRGRGVSWGLEFEGARVSDVRREAPYAQ